MLPCLLAWVRAFVRACVRACVCVCDVIARCPIRCTSTVSSTDILAKHETWVIRTVVSFLEHHTHASALEIEIITHEETVGLCWSPGGATGVTHKMAAVRSRVQRELLP